MVFNARNHKWIVITPEPNFNWIHELDGVEIEVMVSYGNYLRYNIKSLLELMEWLPVHINSQIYLIQLLL